MTDTLTIVVELPASLNAVAALLRVVGDEWPDAQVDTRGPTGWKIRCRAVTE